MTERYIKSLLSNYEDIVYVTNRHWITLLQAALPETLAALAILILVTLASLVWLPYPAVSLAYLLLILPLASLTRKFLIWFNHKYIITTRRVVEVSGIFNKTVSDSSLSKVNDVTMQQTLLGRILDYGDFQILTASELGVDKFEKIGRPLHFKTLLLNAKDELEGRTERPQNQISEKDIPALLAQLEELRQKGILTEAEFQKEKADLLEKL